LIIGNVNLNSKTEVNSFCDFIMDPSCCLP